MGGWGERERQTELLRLESGAGPTSSRIKTVPPFFTPFNLLLFSHATTRVDLDSRETVGGSGPEKGGSGSKSKYQVKVSCGGRCVDKIGSRNFYFYFFFNLVYGGGMERFFYSRRHGKKKEEEEKKRQSF